MPSGTPFGSINHRSSRITLLDPEGGLEPPRGLYLEEVATQSDALHYWPVLFSFISLYMNPSAKLAASPLNFYGFE